MVVWSTRWQAWCLAMDGEGRRQWAMHVNDGGYVEGCGCRIWTEVPLTQFAEILSRSRKAAKFCIYSINYVGIFKPSWYTWFSTQNYYCECNLKVEGSIIPPDSTEFRRNDRNLAGIRGASIRAPRLPCAMSSPVQSSGL